MKEDDEKCKTSHLPTRTANTFLNYMYSQRVVCSTALACYLLTHRRPQNNNKDKIKHTTYQHTQCPSHKFLNQGPENEVTFYFFPVWSIMIYLGHLGCVVTKEDFCLQHLSPTNSALKSIREEMAFAGKTCCEPTHSKQQLQFCQLRKLKIFTVLLSKPVHIFQPSAKTAFDTITQIFH